MTATTETPTIPALSDVLAWRREFCQRFEERAATGDVDYVLAWFLVRRFGVAHLYVDDAAVADLFREHAVRQPGLSVYGPDAASPSTIPPPAAADANAFDSLFLVNVARPAVAAAWASAAASPGAVVVVYGLDAAGGPELTALSSAIGSASEVTPAVALGPALWRLAALVVAHRDRRPVVAAAVAAFAGLFADADLDPLRLAERNLSLRADVQQLSLPGSKQAELVEAQRAVESQEMEVAALRRAVLNQERTIAALTATVAAARSAPTGTNGSAAVAVADHGSSHLPPAAR